jgi:hypothetical protein
MLKRVFRFFSTKNLKKYLLIILGTASWSLTMVRSGLCWDKGCAGGLGFWGANGHDGIWHIALIESLSKGSLRVPIFSGWTIQNYHIGFDLLLSWIVGLTRVSTSLLYFQIIPPLLALLIGILTYEFVYLLRKSESQSLLAVFFVYFGGSFGWLVSLLRGQGWGGESMFWSQQSISTLINPPFALSLVAILGGLIFLLKYLKKKTRVTFCLAALFFGISIFVKVYAGLLVLVSLFAASLWQIMRKKDFSVLGVFLTSLVISLALFLPFNRSSVNLISFSPFWFLESMMALSDRFGWRQMYSAMTTYRMGHVWTKAVLAYGLAFTVFLIGNFGTRIIAFGSVFKKTRKILSAGTVEVFLFVLVLAGIFVPMLFVQKGTPWNTIQFFYYSLIFSGIASGVVLGQIIKKMNWNTSLKYIIAAGAVILTLPTTIASLGNYLPKEPQSALPANEIEALRFLFAQPDGIVLTYPYDQSIKTAAPPTPLYQYTSTAYVSAFSGKQTFLEDQINLDIMQYPWSGRRGQVQDFLNTLDAARARQFLEDSNIAYIYWLTGQYAREGDAQLGLTKIFQNDSVTIFRVD